MSAERSYRRARRSGTGFASRELVRESLMPIAINLSCMYFKMTFPLTNMNNVLSNVVSLLNHEITLTLVLTPLWRNAITFGNSKLLSKYSNQE
jgi:hypothetical protein